MFGMCRLVQDCAAARSAILPEIDPFNHFSASEDPRLHTLPLFGKDCGAAIVTVTSLISWKNKTSFEKIVPCRMSEISNQA